MKRAVCIFICVILIFGTLISVTAAGSDPNRDEGAIRSQENTIILSNMTEQECLNFLRECGVVIPNGVDEDDLAKFAKRVISKVEKEPNAKFAINYEPTLAFAEAIRLAVNQYYEKTEIQSIRSNATLISRAATSLQDSILFGEWTNSFLSYNCYAFALRRTSGLQPGKIAYDKLQENNPIAPPYELNNCDVLNIIGRVEDGLSTIGFTGIYIENSLVSDEDMCANEMIICVRSAGSLDYHFMRCDNGIWYHKPGQTHTLQYIYTPTDERVWTNEAVINGEYFEYDLIYDSPIYFIRFNSHVWNTYTNHNTGTHTKYCGKCDYLESERCSLSYISANSSGHYQKCSLCGYQSVTVAHNMEYTYTSSNKHKGTCRQCGYTTTENCNSSGYQYYGQVDGVHKHRTACSKCSHVNGTTNISCLFKGTSTVCSQCKHDKGISGGTITKKPIQTEQQ